MAPKVRICYMSKKKKDSWFLQPPQKREKDVEIVSFDDEVYTKYSNLKIISVYLLNTIYTCETECGRYLWVEARDGKIFVCVAETSNEIGDHVEIVSKYQGGKPSFLEIVQHMKWKINEEDIWTD